MESIRETAQIYYKVMPEHVKTKAVEFFNKMDNNKDGKVSKAEFAGFMAEEGYVAMNNTSFFKKIDKNNNRELDFNDVKTLYYILESGRPLCRGCREFITGTYFTCVKCFTREAESFCLHRDCFARKDYVHKHKPSNFVDNYALLEFIRKGLLQENKSSKYNKSQGSASTSLAIVPVSSKYNKSQGSASTSSAIVPVSSKYNKSQGSASTSTAIVPQGDGRRRQQKDALQNLREAVGIAAQVVNAVGIVAAVGQCTIL